MNSGIETWTPKPCSTRLESCAAASECPPRSKKLSSGSTSPSSRRNTSSQARASSASFSWRGAVFGEPGDVTRVLSGGSGRRGREFGAVDLARGSLNGERLQLDEDGGNRVVRQAVLQDAPYLLAASRLRVEAPARVAFVVLGVGHDVGDEAFVLALLAFGDDDAGSSRRGPSRWRPRRRRARRCSPGS